jgi:hypothetical protein
MTSVSALFDRKPWALYSELIRLFLLLAIVSSAIDKRIITDFSAPLMREIIKNPAIMTISNIVVLSAAILLLYYDISGKEKKE